MLRKSVFPESKQFQQPGLCATHSEAIDDLENLKLHQERCPLLLLFQWKPRRDSAGSWRLLLWRTVCSEVQRQYPELAIAAFSIGRPPLQPRLPNLQPKAGADSVLETSRLHRRRRGKSGLAGRQPELPGPR